MGGLREAKFHREFLLGKGYSFMHQTNIGKYKGKDVPGLFKIFLIIEDPASDIVTIVKTSKGK